MNIFSPKWFRSSRTFQKFSFSQWWPAKHNLTSFHLHLLSVVRAISLASCMSCINEKPIQPNFRKKIVIKVVDNINTFKKRGKRGNKFTNSEFTHVFSLLSYGCNSASRYDGPNRALWLASRKPENFFFRFKVPLCFCINPSVPLTKVCRFHWLVKNRKSKGQKACNGWN